MAQRRLLLLGASRGLGLALAEEYLQRDWFVVATERGTKQSRLHELMPKFASALHIENVDIVHPDQVNTLKQRLAGQQFDMLFVNAGVKNDDRETIADVSTEEFARVMITNALSPMRVVEALQSLVVARGTIAIMSSGLGSIANNLSGTYEVYRGSKAALNTFMRSYAARHASDARTLLLLAPGWVKTDMGGPEARLTIAESIPSLVSTIEAQRGKAGLQYLDYLGREVPW
jgi:NAD(P)-dependent dehydrogenase (short-subunit alcohol dehydrogenase family)